MKTRQMETRLLLVSHAATPAMRAARFPANDPLDARGLAEAAAAQTHLSLPPDAAAFVSPATCARETAAALALNATLATELADLDYGAWHGKRLADLAAEAPHELAAWTRDPEADAHGGESFSGLVKRVGRWLDSRAAASDAARTVIGVTHAPVVRAAIVHALGASPDLFRRIEIGPLSVIELRHSARGWTWWPASR